jgi:hypothetical protein
VCHKIRHLFFKMGEKVTVGAWFDDLNFSRCLHGRGSVRLPPGDISLAFDEEIAEEHQTRRTNP